MQIQNSQAKSPFNFSWPHRTFGNPQNPAIVFLHGYLGSGKDWQAAAEALAKDFYCICFDLPGTIQNTSINDADISFESVCTKLSAELAKIDKPFYLAGYSMGARIAMYTALNMEPNLKGLILESGTSGIKDQKDRAERAEVDQARAQKIRENGLESFLPKWYGAKLFASLAADPNSLKKTIIQRLQNNAKETAAAVIEQMSPGLMPFMGDRLHELSVPSLVVCGKLDEKYLHVCKIIDKALPKSTLKVVEEAGHNVHLEKPEVFAEIARSFLLSVEADES